MPTVPRLRNTTVRATPEPSRLPAPETFGVDQRAVQAVGGALGNLAGVVQKERDRITDIRVSEGEMDLNSRIDALLAAPGSGLLHQRGTNAVEGLDPFRANVSRAVSEVSAGLGTPEQRALFQRAAARITRSADTRAMGHIGTETERVRDEGFTSGLTSDLNGAVTDALAGKSGEEFRAAGAERIALYGASVGRAPVDIARQVADWNSKTWAAQIQALANTSGGEDRAAQLFEANKDKLTNADDLLRTQKVVETADVLVRSQTAVDELMVQYPASTLAELGKAKADARRQHEGRMEVEVLRGLDDRFGDRLAEKVEADRASLNEMVASVTANKSLVGLTPAQRNLAEEMGQIDNLEALAIQRRNGTAAHTVWSEYKRVWEMDPTERAAMDPMTVVGKFSNSDFEALVKWQVSVREGRAAQGMNPGEVVKLLLSEVVRRKLVGERVNSVSDLSATPSLDAAFNRLHLSVQSKLAALAGDPARHGVPLSSSEQLAAIYESLDDVVLQHGMFGGMFSEEEVLPRAFARPGSTKELSAAQQEARARVQTIPAPARNEGETLQVYWNRLRAGGLTAAQATAITEALRTP